MLGRPNWVVPVLTKSFAGAWLNGSVHTELDEGQVVDHRRQCAAGTPRPSAPLCAVLGELPTRAQQLRRLLGEACP